VTRISQALRADLAYSAQFQTGGHQAFGLLCASFEEDMMGFEHIVVTAIAVLFAIFSVLHGIKNSRRADEARNHPAILRPYYGLTLLWAIAALYLGRDAGPVEWTETAGAAGVVIFIHGIRVSFERTGTAEDAPEPWHRYAIDALANLATIVFAIFAIARNDHWYAVLTLFFGAMMFGKEFKYRVIDDARNAAKSWIKRGRNPEPPPIRKRREFLANYMKSYCYIVIGCSLAYSALTVLDPSVGAVIADNGTQGQAPAWDALWFALRGFILQNDAKHNLLLTLGMAGQFITFVAVGSYFAFSVYRGRE
jgi:hypothetical protein